MNAYERAKSLGFVGTSQEIVDQLKAIPLHHKDIYITGGDSATNSVNILHLLTARHRVMGMDAEQNWVGPLITLEKSDANVAGMMAILRTQLQVNDTKVYCSEIEDAANMVNALTYIVGELTQKHDQVVAEVALMSGGRIGADYANLTVEVYEALELEAITRKNKTDLEAIPDAHYQTFVTKYNSVKSQIEAGTLTTEAEVISAMEAV
jgi:hypothetical protein